jgi:DNA-binding MarR family transcriptional regulator
LLEVVPLIMRVMRGEMRSRRGGELSVPQFRTLAYLDRRPGSALLDVTAHIGLTPPSLSKLIDGLIARKLVTRQISSADRRRITLSLTAQGRAILQRSRKHMRIRLGETLATLTEAENATVQEALPVLERAFLDEVE